MERKPSSLVDILRWRAISQPDRMAFRFLKNGEMDEVCMHYGALDRNARSIAAILQSFTKPGDRILLLLPPGPDFITAFLACLFAQALAIPVPPPHPARMEKTMVPTLRIIEDAQPNTALVDARLKEAINKDPLMRQKFSGIRLLPIEILAEEDNSNHWKEPLIAKDDISFLQYTSGSTSAPKGIMVTHGNLLHNLAAMEKAFAQREDSHAVIWLPPFHDMGLIGGILQPIYMGSMVTLMPPLMFLQKPIRWLEAITRYRATGTGGPNFAYDLCVRKIKPDQRERLDLSSLEIAFNGAEPVNPGTLDAFAECFAPCGFRREAFRPCYGIAEATLLVTGGPAFSSPLTLSISKDELRHHTVLLAEESAQDAQEVVGCGHIAGEQEIMIVDTERGKPCAPDEIGEIWIRGKSVAKGYWNKPHETEETFGCRIPGDNGGHYLHTGDLGFFHNGELFITGRIKNLIIVAGKNHYPQDIERTIAASHHAIRMEGCAVFALHEEGIERVVALVEMNPKELEDMEDIEKMIKGAVAEAHELQLHDIRLILPGGIPKTTSGKTRHFLCRDLYINGNLKEIKLV